VNIYNMGVDILGALAETAGFVLTLVIGLWPLALILVGAVIIYKAVRRRT